VLQNVTAVESPTGILRDGEAADDISVSHIRGEAASVFGVKLAGQWDTLKSQRGAGIEVEP
jgi:hypothetical protein